MPGDTSPELAFGLLNRLCVYIADTLRELHSTEMNREQRLLLCGLAMAAETYAREAARHGYPLPLQDMYWVEKMLTWYALDVPPKSLET